MLRGERAALGDVEKEDLLVLWQEGGTVGQGNA
jgi:hypothetical protein